MTGQTPFLDFFAVRINPIMLFQLSVQCRSRFKATWMFTLRSLNILHFQVEVSTLYPTEQRLKDTRIYDITCLCGELKVFELPHIWPFCLPGQESSLCSAPGAVWTLSGNVCKSPLHPFCPPPLVSSYCRGECRFPGALKPWTSLQFSLIFRSLFV